MAFIKAEQMAATAAALLVIFLTVVPPPVGAAVDKNTCLPSVVSLMPCLPFVQNKASTPSAACCQNLAHVLQVQPLCLCAVLDGEASGWLGIPVDAKRALALPPACRLRTPPISECNASADSP